MKHSTPGGPRPEPSHVQIAGYASGNFAKNILWHSAEVSVLYIFTDLLGYDVALAGTLLLLSLVWDAAMDPLIGLAADKTRTRFGRYGPYILAGGPLAAVLFILLFSLPLFSETPVLLSVVILLGFRAAYSLIDLPHNALIASVSQNSRKRTEIASLRFFFSSLASMLLSLSLPVILSDTDTVGAASRFSTYAIFAGSLSCFIIILSWSMIARFDRFATRNTDKAATFRAGWTHTRQNGPLLLILTVGALATLTTPLFSKGVIYLSKYVWEDAALSGPALLAMVIGQLVSLPVWTVVSGRFEKSQGLAAAHLVLAAAFLASLLVSLLMTNTSAHGVLIGLAFMAGFGAGGIYALIWSLLPDAIDEGESRLGMRHEGMQFGLLIFGMKAASALGTWVLAFALDMAGYQPNGAQTDLVKMTILLIIYGAPVAGSVTCALLLSRYRITHDTHEESISALTSNRRYSQSQMPGMPVPPNGDAVQ